MKYDPLKNHLAKLAGSKWTASFREIEDVLGFSLPKSAREYPAWWANQEYGTQTSSWKKAGWLTADLQLSHEKITFLRSNGARKDTKNTREPTRQVKTQHSFPVKWDILEELSGSLQMIWEPLGCIVLDAQGRLTFPITPALPGLYRFRIREKGKNEARYVGESDNLHRRFNTNYRHGNVSQHTSHRINQILKNALAKNAEISISLITDKAWLKSAGAKQKVDLSSKAVRRLFEHFAQCVEGDCIIETLNL